MNTSSTYLHINKDNIVQDKKRNNKKEIALKNFTV